MNIIDDGRRGSIVCRSSGNSAYIRMNGKNPFKVGWYTCDACIWSCFAARIGNAVAAHARITRCSGNI